jgi:uncharacterized protein YyaL (SSP411 family)
MAKKNTRENENAAITRLIEIDKSSLPPDGGPNFNRLIFAGSPYLLQHAQNPVDWHEWGEEAFVRAKNENKPVFLSIGYATCHWCHVMERESFEDFGVADVLNRNFVSIKVDREERPDIDDQYMTVAHLMNGGGGWPLNAFLTPDKKPFYVATYIPKTARSGMAGIIEILEKIAEVWKTQRDVVENTCAAIIKNLTAAAEPTPAPLSGTEVIADAYRHLEMLYDRKWGGFGSAPKFPRPLFISFLLRYWQRTGVAASLEMAEQSLRKMRGGGIYDQLGFGFHRYSVDEKWLVPHFEKMLYDQAMLAISYIEAFQSTGKDFYIKVAEEVFAFVQREMTSPEGGFYSAWDADTEGVEGKYYVWTPAEVLAVLGEETAERVCRLYDITEKGNFEGKSILHLQIPVSKIAEIEGVDGAALCSDLERWRKLLLSAREKRTKPLRDEKILTSWNSVMIAALAKGFAVTGEAKYLDAAANALNFIKKRLITQERRLQRSYYRGESVVSAFLEDYAFFVWGLIELYEATLETEYLLDAINFSEESLRLFADSVSYGLFDTGCDAENILIRKKSTLDGVIPSGNSVAAMNFLRLGRITSNQDFIKEGEGILRSLMGNALEQPTGYFHSLAALDYLRGPEVDITLIGGRTDRETEEMLRCVTKRFIPGLSLRFKDTEKESTDYKAIGGRTTAYVCTHMSCRPPVVGSIALESLLDEIAANREN